MKPTIPGYQVIEKIASGGMATVWKAKQTSLDRIVALKVLNRGVIKTETDVALFRQEAQAAARLHHPGLCQIYDAGEYEDTVYIVMEYIAGSSVGRMVVEQGGLPEARVWRVAEGVARVLQAIWARHRVVHCDIKPDNILLDEDGQVRVTDFGVARFIGERAQDQDRDYFCGTPNYTSPEQVQGMEDLDGRTDMYGLGATLYHLLTGQIPFARLQGEEAMESHCTDYLADLQEIDPRISDGAAALVEKLMIKDRDQRYADWRDVLADIQAVRAGRLPAKTPVPAGLSTVRRSAAREQSMRRTRAAMQTGAAAKQSKPLVDGDVPRLKPTGAARPRTVAGPLATGRSRVPRKRERWGWTAAYTLLLLPVVGGAYWAVFFRQAPQAQLEAEQVTELHSVDSPPVEPVAPVPSPPRERAPEPAAADSFAAAPADADMRPQANRPLPPPERETSVAAPPAGRPAPREQAPSQREAWDHPDYVKAMGLLRGADAALQRFLQERDTAVLLSVESDCRRAIELLNGLRHQAPPQAQIGERIRQGYQLIAHSRRMR